MQPYIQTVPVSVLSWLIITLVGVVMGLLSWNANRLHRRVDDLEKYKADNEALVQAQAVTTGRFERLEKSLDAHRKETTEGLNNINQNVIQLLLRNKS